MIDARVAQSGRGGARQWLMPLTALSLCLVAAPAHADPETARRHYAQALEYVESGDLPRARDAFQLAYRESPHYLVLYNLGRVSFDLGEYQAAQSYFSRYLAQGGDAIAPERREVVEALIAKARAEQTTTQAPGPEPAAFTDQPPSSSGGLSHRAPDEVRPAVPRSPGPTRARAADRVEARSSGDARTTLAITLGATGAALAIGGAAVLAWNQSRYGDYEDERDRLDSADPPRRVGSQEELDAFLDHARAEERNEAELESIEQFDVVGWTLAGAGAALAASGLVLYLTRSQSASVALGARRVSLGITW